MYYTDYYSMDRPRFGFAVPFLLGGLVGGGAVAVSRPRPVIATGGPIPPYGYYPNYPYNNGPYFY